MYVGLAIISGVLLSELRRWLGILALLNAGAGGLVFVRVDAELHQQGLHQP